jgi:zinc finger protein
VARARNGEIEKVFGKYTSPEEVMTFPGTCDNCGAEAQTRMFVTNIPFFGEVIIMSNSCDTCGSKNSEVKAGGGVSDKGHKITLNVVDEIDMNRDVIKSDTSSVTIPYLDLTTSLGTMGGIVTTVEGLLKEIQKTLKSTGRFQLGDSATKDEKQKWTEWYAKFDKVLALEEAFTIELDDPLGHCFITPLEDKVEDDDRLTVVDYERTHEQDVEFGIADMKLNEEMNNLD